MSKKYIALLSLLLVLVLAFVAACAPVSDDNNKPDGPDDDWHGNWERPDHKDDDIDPITHVCQNACTVCGKCLTDCQEEACKEKCFEAHGRTEYVFSGIDDRVDKKGGVWIEGDHLGHVNANLNAEVTYYVKAAEATTVCLGATVSRMYEDRYFSAGTPLTINGELYFSRGMLKGGSTVWTDFCTMWLGCVNLNKGVNVLRFTGTDEAYNFKDFKFLSDVELKLVSSEDDHECTSKDANGKCTDYTCNNYACLDKNEDGWKVKEFGAGDERILKYGTRGGKEQSLWNANENCIGYMGEGEISGWSNQTIILAFEASQDTVVRVSMSTSTAMSSGAPFGDMYTFTFNGEEITTGAKVNMVENSGWMTYTESKVLYVQAKAGKNTLMIVHKPVNMGDNVNKFVLSAQSGDVTLAYANKPGETVAVEGVTLATEGGVNTIKNGETLQLVTEFVPGNATNRNVTYTSSANDVATVSDKGLVTAVGKGTATITVTTDDGGKTAEVTINVADDQQAILVTNIKLTASKTNVLPEETVTLSATVTPQNATNAELTWKVLRNGIVVDGVLTVGQDGTATFVATEVGTYTILVSATDGSQVTDEVEIAVEEPLTGTDHFFEGENATLTGGSMGDISINTSDGNGRSNTSLGNVNMNIGAKLTFTVIAANDCRMGLYVSLGFGVPSADNILKLKVNGVELTTPTHFVPQVANWITFEEFWLANVSLVKGDNTIELTVTGSCGNFDYMTLKGDGDVSEPIVIKSVDAYVNKELLRVNDTVECKVAVLPAAALEGLKKTYASDNDKVVMVSDNGLATAVGVGKATITVTAGEYERKINLFVVDNDGTAYEAEADGVVRTNVSIESNGTYVGGINNNGAKVGFTVDGGEGGKVLLRIYTSVVAADRTTIDKYYKIAVNGVEIDLTSGQFAYNGQPVGWNTDTGYFTIEIDLNAGDNTIELISVGTGVQTTLDKIVIY